MLFRLMAPFYDRFMKWAGMDHSSSMAAWLDPVEGKDLLDLGGGTGINASALAAAGARVTIVDSSDHMLDRARSKGLNARLIRADAGDLPLPDRSFDIVLISDAWHHFSGQDRVLSQIVRVLRPGGRLYIIDFDRKKLRTWYLIAVEKLVGEPSSFWTTGELDTALRSRGIHGEFRYLTTNQFIYSGVKE